MYYCLHFIDEKEGMFNLAILYLGSGRQIRPQELLAFCKTKMPLSGANSAPVLLSWLRSYSFLICEASGFCCPPEPTVFSLLGPMTHNHGYCKTVGMNIRTILK